MKINATQTSFITFVVSICGMTSWHWKPRDVITNDDMVQSTVCRLYVSGFRHTLLLFTYVI